MNCRVVHLASRPDRMINITVEMKKLDIDYDIFFAVDPEGITDRAMASSCTHIDALRGIAGELLVCEDDVTFIHQSKELFKIAYNELPEDWDMLYLGGNIHEPGVRFSESLFRINKAVHCNHAILYSEKARDFILQNYDLWTNEIKAYDHWLYLVGQGLMNCYMCSPVLAYQKPGYSYSGLWADYYIDMRSNEIKNLK
jgi:GR25 family glycosyltransferase involved in LPS biosynthesis